MDTCFFDEILITAIYQIIWSQQFINSMVSTMWVLFATSGTVVPKPKNFGGHFVAIRVQINFQIFFSWPSNVHIDYILMHL